MFGQAEWSSFPSAPPAPACRPPRGFRSQPADLSGEQDGRVEVLWVPVAGLVETSLPAAEVAQGQATVVRHFRAPSLILHYQDFHHHQVDGIPNAGVFVDAGCHGH